VARFTASLVFWVRDDQSLCLAEPVDRLTQRTVLAVNLAYHRGFYAIVHAMPNVALSPIDGIHVVQVIQSRATPA
jgi:hypothetical protein